MSSPPFLAEAIVRLLAQESMVPEVRERLQWFLYLAEGQSVSATCRQFGIARTTLYRWLRRFDPADLSTLEDLSTRPDVVRGVPTSEAASVKMNAPTLIPIVDIAQLPPVPAAALSAAPAPAVEPQPVSHRPPEQEQASSHCLFCALRSNWPRIRRSFFLMSIVANVFFIGALLGIAWLEGKRIDTASFAASAAPHHAPFQLFSPRSIPPR